MQNFYNDTVESIALGRQFDEALSAFILNKFRSKRMRDAYHIEFKDGEVWLFEYGVLVCWGIAEDTKQGLLQHLTDFVDLPLKQDEFERYSFSLNGEQAKMHADHIVLTSDNSLDRLAVSHALAQSIKLTVFEAVAQRVIQENEYIPRTLANTGKIPLSRNKLAKLRGTLFSTKNDIILNFGLLDTPEFFWDYPEVEPLYLIISRYLDVTPRITVLNKKMEAIHELLEMLASEQNHKHSSFLEWIIIILIAMEILLFFWH